MKAADLRKAGDLESKTKPIHATAKNVRELLGVKYSIDYYQREYRWGEKQVHELLDDLSEAFLAAYESGMRREKVADFPDYFLGPIIISQSGSKKYIVDGQQRLTTLTLLLILLRNLQRDRDDAVLLDALICSVQYGVRSFNLDVDERARCMEALYDNELDAFDESDESESVQNLCEQYTEMEWHFHEALRDEALPYFIDWLIDHVRIVEISAYADEDAYNIFETMNDRGLSLSPIEMLKGYLLAKMEESRRAQANELWRARLHQLTESNNDYGPDFFKSWFRSQYARTTRKRRKGAYSLDFERIGTEFHRWLRERTDTLGLEQSEDFYRFVDRDFNFYSKQYILLRRAQDELVAGLEHVFYNAGHGFTLQDMLLLAPLRPEDSEATIRLKLRLVARFVDIVIAWRIWNSRSIAYSTMQYTIFQVMRSIRGLDPDALAEKLHATLIKESETFRTKRRLRMHQQNRRHLHRLLARMTDYVETQSGHKSHYIEYVATGKNRYEIEHILADHPEQHEEEFGPAADFAEARNQIGGLLLLPKKSNASYGDLPYEAKVPHYNTQNLLARSLHPQAYDRNPGFLQFITESGLHFRAHEQFKKADLDERGELYRRLAERIWDPDDLLREVGS